MAQVPCGTRRGLEADAAHLAPRRDRAYIHTQLTLHTHTYVILNAGHAIRLAHRASYLGALNSHFIASDDDEWDHASHLVA